jgi:hypothetical protein
MDLRTGSIEISSEPGEGSPAGVIRAPQMFATTPKCFPKLFGMSRCLIFLLLFSTFAFGEAGPPLITDDPNTPEVGKWEINLAVVSELSKSISRFEAPLGDFNYGWSERLQLKWEVPLVIYHETGHTTTTSSSSLAGAKYRFFDDKTFSVSSYPQIGFLGLGDPPKTDNSNTLLIPIELQEKIGRWSLNEEIGYLGARGQFPQYDFGVAVSYRPIDKYSLLAELHGFVMTDLTDTQTIFNIGATCDFSETYTLLLSAGQTLHPFRDDPYSFLSYVGLQLHL